MNPQDSVLHMSVAQQLKAVIIKRKMQPGDKLPTEKELMKEFGISRSTLREAMKILKAENVIVQKLKTIVDAMYASDSNDSYTEEMDIRFHTAIAECTHNDVLTRVVPIINESIRRGHVETHDDTASFYRAKRSHLGIYRAIAERDYMEAKFLVERHIWETLNDIKSKEDKS